MKKPLKASFKTSSRAIFLRKKLCFTPKNGKKPLKTPPAVDYRGIFDQKKYAVKEPDPETGLYYYGARYLDPKTSRWISGDPALGEYLPVAPLGDEEKKRNRSLPGQGGVFNYVNLHVYHYAGNNPVRYVDPDGRWTDNGDGTFTAEQGDTLWGLYGADWQEKSGYSGDPTELQVGDVVGIKDPLPSPTASESISLLPSTTSTQTAYKSAADAHEMLAGVEIVGTGASFMAAGGLGITSALAGASTAGIAATAGGVIAGGGFIILGGAIVLVGIDLLEGNGLDKTMNFIDRLKGKKNE